MRRCLFRLGFCHKNSELTENCLSGACGYWFLEGSPINQKNLDCEIETKRPITVDKSPKAGSPPHASLVAKLKERNEFL